MKRKTDAVPWIFVYTAEILIIALPIALQNGFRPTQKTDLFCERIASIEAHSNGDFITTKNSRKTKKIKKPQENRQKIEKTEENKNQQKIKRPLENPVNSLEKPKKYQKTHENSGNILVNVHCCKVYL